jgi:hypothetical protein
MADPTHTIDHHKGKKPQNPFTEVLNTSQEVAKQKSSNFDSGPVIN